jgi:hypothetical protein
MSEMLKVALNYSGGLGAFATNQATKIQKL